MTQTFSPDILNATKSWPFVEARKILKRFETHGAPSKGFALFETGYGPSGLPHIGTFGEVLRTSLVRHAFQQLSDIPTRLFAFSDDMDGLRKVPDNVPNQAMLQHHLGKPLTHVPDPYEKFESFGHHNNAMLCRFLDSFGFDYEFQSSTAHYKSGAFDATLLSILKHYDAIRAIILPTLRSERQATYSPFLPICPKTGIVLQVPTLARDVDAGTITYKDPVSEKHVEVPVTGGACKLQWKVDWAMRWRAFDVDYEMSGKDLIDSVKLSSRICQTLGGNKPETLTYELFLDEQGQKISKSKGNGLTIDEWLTYAPKESLAYYMFQAPAKAKRLYFDVIPKHVDDYIAHAQKFSTLDDSMRLDNPIYHIHNGVAPTLDVPLNFQMLLNLASVVNCQDPEILWGFVSKYAPQTSPSTHPYLHHLIQCAVRYYHDFVAPHKHYRVPIDIESDALLDLKNALEALSFDDHHEKKLQEIVFEVGKRHPFPDLRTWFGALYEVLLGQTEGPRFGSFIAVYGVPETIHLIDEKINNQPKIQ